MRLQHLLKRILLGGASVYLGLVLGVYFSQERLVYYPANEPGTTPADIGLAYGPVTLTAEDGTRLAAWFVPAGARNRTVLFLHGNGGNLSHYLEYARLYHRLDLNALLIDYRGYGQSAGAPNEQGTYQDAEAAWRYLTEIRAIPPDRIVVAGLSLGGGVATWLAQHHQPAGLVLDSTFTSLVDMGELQLPWLPVRPLMRNRYPSIERIGTIDAPILIIHSRADGLIPFSQAEQLYAAARQPKTFLEIQGGHGAGIVVSRDVYARGMEAFVRGLP